MSNHSFQTAKYVEEIASLIAKITGNILGEKQYPVVESRLRKRISELGLADMHAYMQYLRNNYKEETNYLVSLLTTHHTFFFREFIHFEYLLQVLPELILTARKRPQKTIRIWSAACSRGHEVYSLAMFFAYHLKQQAPDIDFHVHGSDIDVQSVKIAQNAVYRINEIKKVPLQYLDNYFIQGKGDIADFVKVSKRLTQKCSFEVLNLLDLSKMQKMDKFDVIFCRNIFIYFNSEMIKQITLNLLNCLTDSGILMTGVSESLSNLDLPIVNHGRSVYGKKVKRSVDKEKSHQGVTTYTLPTPIKVVCVDDSPVILKILKKIFTSVGGYKVVGTASNGVEAVKVIQQTNPDVVTLDIHMPVCDGIEYLRRNYGKEHPPVIMVTSVNRNELDISLKALELGAADFIEKPTFEDFISVRDELFMKINAAIINQQIKGKKDISNRLQTDKMLAKQIVVTNPEKKLAVLFLSLSELEKAKEFLSSFRVSRPPVVMVLNDSKNIEFFHEKLRPFGALDSMDGWGKGKVLLLSALDELDGIIGNFEKHNISAVFYTSWISKLTLQIASRFTGHVLFEECGPSVKSKLALFRADHVEIIPSTSFAYHVKSKMSELD